MKAVKIISLLVFVLAVGGGVAFLILGTEAPADDQASSKEYAESAVYNIFSGWDAPAAFAMGDAEFQRQNPEIQLERTFSYLRDVLGGMDKYEEAKGQARNYWSPGSGWSVQARYVVEAQFFRGDGTVTLTIKREGDKWWLDDWKVESPLMQQ